MLLGLRASYDSSEDSYVFTGKDLEDLKSKLYWMLDEFVSVENCYSEIGRKEMLDQVDNLYNYSSSKDYWKNENNLDHLLDKEGPFIEYQVGTYYTIYEKSKAPTLEEFVKSALKENARDSFILTVDEARDFLKNYDGPMEYSLKEHLSKFFADYDIDGKGKYVKDWYC